MDLDLNGLMAWTTYLWPKFWHLDQIDCRLIEMCMAQSEKIDTQFYCTGMLYIWKSKKSIIRIITELKPLFYIVEMTYIVVLPEMKNLLQCSAQSINEVPLFLNTLDGWGRDKSWADLYAIIAESIHETKALLTHNKMALVPGKDCHK